MKGLAPGLVYVFTVRAYLQDLLGPSSSIEVKTDGQKLKPVVDLHYTIPIDNRTTVKLAWKKPVTKDEVN